MRDKLIKLIKDSLKKNIGKSCLLAKNIADYLLENGVIVLPCNIGDTIYDTREYIYGAPCPEIYEMKSDDINIEKDNKSGEYRFIYDNVYISFDEFGKVLFLTREDAEKALKGGVQE